MGSKEMVWKVSLGVSLLGAHPGNPCHGDEEEGRYRLGGSV